MTPRARKRMAQTFDALLIFQFIWFCTGLFLVSYGDRGAANVPVYRTALVLLVLSGVDLFKRYLLLVVLMPAAWCCLPWLIQVLMLLEAPTKDGEQGARVRAIDRLTTHRFNDDDDEKKEATDTCPICLERFADCEVRTLPCHATHMFHVHCVDRWLLQRATCPVCRTNVLQRFEDEQRAALDDGPVVPSVLSGLLGNSGGVGNANAPADALPEAGPVGAIAQILE
jgi:hypothetical protein